MRELSLTSTTSGQRPACGGGSSPPPPPPTSTSKAPLAALGTRFWRHGSRLCCVAGDCSGHWGAVSLGWSRRKHEMHWKLICMSLEVSLSRCRLFHSIWSYKNCVWSLGLVILAYARQLHSNSGLNIVVGIPKVYLRVWGCYIGAYFMHIGTNDIDVIVIRL
jgi:hypothetical protein